MSDSSRRKFLAAAGAGAAAGTVGAVGLTGPAAAAPAETRRRADSARESVVAYVQDHEAGTLRLLVGEREVVLEDRDLVTRLLNAAGGR